MKHRIYGHVLSIGPVVSASAPIREQIKAFADEIRKYSLTRPKVLFEAECWLEGPKSYVDNIMGGVNNPDLNIKELHAAYAEPLKYELFVHLGNMAPADTYFANPEGQYGWWEEEEE